MTKGKFNNPKERAIKISNSHKRRTDIEIGNFFDCIVCGSKFWRKPCAIKKGENKFCSKKCYQLWQKGKKKNIHNPFDRHGANNPNWRGGITSVIAKIRYSEEYKKWRDEVFIRDNWTCQKCGDRSRKNSYIRIEAHHIKPFAVFPELRFIIDNGITLCKKCHAKEPKGREVFCLK